MDQRNTASILPIKPFPLHRKPVKLHAKFIHSMVNGSSQNFCQIFYEKEFITNQVLPKTEMLSQQLALKVSLE